MVDSRQAEAPAVPGRVPTYGVRVVRDLRIPVGDGQRTLAADLFLPETNHPVPALVTLLPYRKDAFAGIGGWASYRWFAARGFAAVLADLRGTGSSDGPRQPPFDPGEGADGAAVVEWAAEQAWCSGNVGMWGVSYGAMTALRTACHQPAHLRAILPVMGALDPERDFVHPAGTRGCLGPLGIWSMDTLLGHLLPPLHPATEADRRRWLDRLEHDEPYLLDLLRHGPAHPAWTERRIDATRIGVPTFCVAGWRDLFCDATLRAYEQVSAPKKLLVGPWMHTVPHESPFTAIDFHTLALDWWSRWLIEEGRSVPHEPAVTIHVQGGRPRWRAHEVWPPRGTEVSLRAADGHLLRPGEAAATGEAGIGQARADPTVGALSGLWGVPTTGFGLPLDQHDDDLRGAHYTTEPLQGPMLICGRPSVSVGFGPGGEAGRVVAKLTDVDTCGRSKLITSGIAVAAGACANGQRPDLVRIELHPTAYEVAQGHRLRLVLARDDFPRIWPAPTPAAPTPMVAAEVLLPVDPRGQDIPAPASPPAEAASGLAVHDQHRWNIARDPLNDTLSVTIAGEVSAFTPAREHLVTVDRSVTARVGGEHPADARIEGHAEATVRSRPHQTVTVHVELVVTANSASARGEVVVDGTTMATKHWSS